jgi:hypothetical protein
VAQEQSRRPGTPAWKAAGGPSKASSGPQFAWKPQEAEKQSHWARRFKLAGAFGGGLACLGLIGLLIWYLRPHERACLVVVGNDPAADLERLDTPLDPYGWHGGQRLAELAARTAERQSELPLRLAGDGQQADSIADLPGFLQKLERREYNPLIVYFGLHGGADPTGPFLFAPGGGRVYVRELIDGFAGSRLRDKKVVLLFDTARLAPDPALGVLFPDFVRAVKGLEAEGLFANVPNLVVICASDAGERGWDAEEWATTGFAEMLRHGLGGEAAAAKGSIITAASLFDYVQRQTQSWSQMRPTAQTPILLPAAGGRERAAQIDLTVTAKSNAAVDWPEPAEFAPPKALTDHLTACKALEDGTPSPAVYTPRLWRRYRELLLRYEQLLRAGDDSTRLSDKLEKMEQELRDGRRLRLTGNAEPTSWRNSMPLPAALGMTVAAVPDASFGKIWSAPEADWDGLCKALLESSGGDPEQVRARFYDYLLRKATKATGREDVDRAARLMMRPVFTEAGWRPAEAHLLVMTRQFFDTVKSAEPPPPRLWARALEVRRLAEQATLGVRPATAGHPYSEQLWTVLEKQIVEADIRRRDGEDWLFTSAGQDRAGQELDASAKQYEDALRKAESLQAAYAARDEALADLPLLTRWVALLPAKATDSRTEEVHNLWINKVHPLARRLEVGGSGLAGETFNQLAKEVHDGAARIKDNYGKRCDYLHGRANLDLQEDWEQVEQVLAVPPMLIQPNVRKELAESNRRRANHLSESWRSNPKTFNSPSPAEADALRDTRRVQARQWGELAAAVLGDIAKEQQSDRKGTLHSAEGLRIDLTRFSAENWQATADEMGDHVGRHWRLLGDRDAPQNDEGAEFRSRFATAFLPTDAPEPATVNRQKRWQKLLVGLALRTVRDHWYYESPEVKRPKQYFVAAADRFLEDSARCTAATTPTEKKPAGPDDDIRQAQQLRNAGALQLEPAAPIKLGQRIAWTTENQRTLTFAIKANGGPGGYVTFWPDMVRPASLAVRGDDLSRQPVRLESKRDQPAEATRDVRVEADRKAVSGSVTLTARGYFRGQWPICENPIDLNRTPELIMARAVPPNDAALAVRAGDDFDAGAIAIVLDFSGSMAELPGPNGKPLIGPDRMRVRNWNDENSKNRQAIRTLRDVLLGLPKGTPISLRLFGYDYEDGARRGMPETQLARMTKDKLIYPAEDQRGEGKVTWSRSDPNTLDDSIIEPLKKIEPQGHTPLLRTMVKAKGDFPRNYKGPKTLLVLTDGMDNLEDPDQLKAKLEAEFKDADISIQMVFFRVDDAELIKARKQFENVTGFSAPGAISVVEENSKLKERIDQALRPKLRLLDAGVPVAKLPPSGLPADRLTAPLNGLWWSPKFDAGTFTGEVLPRSRQVIHLRGGDRLLVRLTKDSTGVKFSRDLLAADPRLKGRVTPRDERDEWVLGLPYYHAAPTERDEPLRLTATLESPKGLSPGRDGNLEQIHPEFVWWEVVPQTGKPPKTVRVTARSQLPAPAWTLLAEGWPGGANSYKPATVRAWAAQYPPPSSCQVQFSTAAVAAGEARAVEPSKDGAVQVFASVEDWPLRVDTDPKNDFETADPKTEKCLVVRVLHEHNKPVFVRPVGIDFQASEHRYYPPSDSVTAVFGPVNSKDDLDAKLRGGALVLDLISVERFKLEHKPAVLAMPDPPSRTETPLVGPPSLGEKLEKAP